MVQASPGLRSELSRRQSRTTLPLAPGPRTVLSFWVGRHFSATHIPRAEEAKQHLPLRRLR